VSAAAARSSPVPRGEAVEVVHFRLGKRAFLVARGDVRAIRHSPRVRLAREGRLAAGALPVVSLSELLQLGRDTSVDRRLIEVDHWGSRLGLEVTAIAGIVPVRVSALHPLPPFLVRNATSRCLLGLAWLDGEWAIALDLSTLLVERGVEVPSPAEGEGIP